VTVFGSARDHDLAHANPASSALEQAHHAFVFGADRAFMVSAIFLALTVVLVGFVIKPVKPTAPTETAETPYQDADRASEGQPIAAS
jgi:hypothetical protein